MLDLATLGQETGVTMLVPEGLSMNPTLIDRLAARIRLDPGQMAQLCRAWRVAKLAVFGSVLRDDFGSDSDVDLLVTFLPDSEWSLWDIVRMKEEMAKAFGHPVDLIEESALENPFIRHEVLRSNEVIYAAAVS